MKRRAREQAGMSLLEVLVANTLLLIAVVGLLGMFNSSIVANKVQGETLSRATIFAQAKMEELMALSYFDLSTDTTVWPAATGGMGLSDGGSIDPDDPQEDYIDYLDADGMRLPDENGAYFMRQWQIVDSATLDPLGNPTSKTISVAVFTLQLSPYGEPPSTYLVNIKANY